MSKVHLFQGKSRLWSLFFLTVLSITSLQAQRYTTAHGYVLDAKTGEKLIHAFVFDKVSQRGATTNAYGFYSLTIQTDSAHLVASYIGYGKQNVSLLNSKGAIMHSFSLPLDNVLKEVTVTGVRGGPVQNQVQMSAVQLSMKNIKNLPVLFGEPDLLKIIQLLPGVKGGTEGSSGFYVRGGGPDQNLVLIDGVPVYNVSHLFGFFSIFNSDAINNVQLIKGGFPAEYGGRLSSVLDIRLKEGNRKEFHGEGSVGVISSKLMLEGPLIKDKTSFLLSERRTYLDVLAQPFIRAQSKGATSGGYYFYDLNGKINHKINDKNQLYLSWYQGRDVVYGQNRNEFTNEGSTFVNSLKYDLGWGNRIGTFRWNYQITPKLFSNATVTYSKYNFSTGITQDETETPLIGPVNKEFFAVTYLSSIQDYAGKLDFDYMANPNHTIKFGASVTRHRFEPGTSVLKMQLGGASIDTTFGSYGQTALDYTAYLQDDFSVGPRWRMNAGVHMAAFEVNGTLYQSLQPRVSARYLLSESTSLKASYVHMTQFLHLLTNQSIGLPTDLWVPVTEQIKPQESWQIAAGIASNLGNDFELSVEGYYKDMRNLIEYKEGSSFLTGNADWQEKVTTGRGWAYGGEFLLEKKAGKFTGWLGYTLSWTERLFEDINFGNPYPYTYDRRHDVSFTLSYPISTHWTFGGVFVYGTGRATTLPTARFIGSPYQNFWNMYEYVRERNNYREPAYHRMDLSFTHKKETRWGSTNWSFGVYNAYNRINPFFLNFETTDSGARVLKAYGLFPIIPSISYGFSF